LEKKQQPDKRPLALPITLLILVLSVMGNVLLYTKNIEHSQNQSQKEGKAVFTSFEKARDVLNYWSGLADEAKALPADSSDEARLTSRYLAEAMERGKEPLEALFVKASELEEAAFANAPADFDAYIDKYREPIKAIGDGSGSLTDAEHAALDAAKSSFAELDGMLAEFHFTGADDRNVLLRLSGGHDWLPIAEKLHKAILK